MAAPEEPPVSPPVGRPTTAQRRILWTALTALAVISLLGVAGVVFFGFVAFLGWCYPILLPVGLAVIIALVLEPAVEFVQKKRAMKRENAALAVCVLAAVGFVLFWAFLSRPVFDSTAQFFQKLPGYFNAGIDKLNQTMDSTSPKVALDFHPATPPLAPPPEMASTNQLTIAPVPLTKNAEPAQGVPDTGIGEARSSAFQTWLKSNVPSIEQSLQKNVANVIYSALGPVGQAFGFMLGFGFVPIYVYYFLADQERISRNWHQYVPLRQSPLRDEVVSVIAEISASLVSYFRGQIIVAACNGVLTFIGLWIIGIGFSNSLVLGIITGALSIVPFLGIICSIIPALLLGFLSAPDDSNLQWLRPLLVLVVFAVVQTSESTFITPRVQSHSTGLHPLTIILGILFWSMLLPGLLGPIVAVPLTCAVVVLLRRYVWLERTKPATTT
jgi:predicted PurR-regulated permease PerM